MLMQRKTELSILTKINCSVTYVASSPGFSSVKGATKSLGRPVVMRQIILRMCKYILFTEYREDHESVASIVTSAVGTSDNAAPDEWCFSVLSIYPTARPDICKSCMCLIWTYKKHMFTCKTCVNTYSAIWTARYCSISRCSSLYIFNGASPELYDKTVYHTQYPVSAMLQVPVPGVPRNPLPVPEAAVEGSQDRRDLHSTQTGAYRDMLDSAI